MSLRIAFDGRALTSPAGGIRRYTHELFAALSRVAPELRITAIGVDRTAGDGIAHIAHTAARLSLPTNLGWSLTGLPLTVRRSRYDLFHAPAYTAPLWGVRPLVLTIHDVSYARHPEWYPYRLDPLRKAFYRSSARRADRILTDSTFSRDEIVAAYDLDPARIDVVALGVGGQFTAREDIPREPFVLHVGDLHPRRNLSMLLDAVLELRRTDACCASLRLVLAGIDRGVLEPLKARAGARGDALQYVGQPSDEALVDFYRRASVFAYPSRYEGFGLPILEAMACGAPVVASSAASIPEIVGDAGLLVPVDDPRRWRDALQAVVTDAARAADLVARGRTRAALFTWERTARETLVSYRRAIGEKFP